MKADDATTGGCYCGAIRYRLEGAPLHSTVCHCSNCRRAAGAQSVAWITVGKNAFHIERGKPARFRTETNAWRTFCAECGTSLTYEGDDRPQEIDITTGSLDAPQDFPPTEDVWIEERVEWVPPLRQEK